MKTETQEVTTQQKTVGTAEYYIFDSIDEAVSTIGNVEVLDLINVQHKTRKMNLIRAMHAKPSRKIFEDRAYDALATLSEAERNSLIINTQKLREFLKKETDRLEEEWKQSRTRGQDTSDESTEA